jgi:HEAT repeats
LALLMLIGALAAQIPAKLAERLKDKDSSIRQAAIKDLAAMDPTSQVTASMIASALATALKDEDVFVRGTAAERLGAGRPGDIAVPALVKAFAAVDKDFIWARRVLAGNPPESDRPRSSVTVGLALAMVPLYPGDILSALRDHQDDRAVTGVVDVLKSWKLERIAGLTIQKTCEELCLRGTQPALDAVVEVLGRGVSFIESHPSGPAPDSRSMTPKEMMAFLYRPVGTDHIKMIIGALDKAVVAAGIERPVSFDPGVPSAWRDLLKANAAKIPKRVGGSQAASRPTASSRPAPSK